tara:strand:- start:1323 stop:1550 length:228 start_codon:yes stop_codon:yes gene_type:complete
MKLERIDAMSEKNDAFMAAIKAGDMQTARAMLEEEKIKAEFAPDTITQTSGKAARFTKKGKEVEVGEDGVWRLKR